MVSVGNEQIIGLGFLDMGGKSVSTEKTIETSCFEALQRLSKKTSDLGKQEIIMSAAKGLRQDLYRVERDEDWIEWQSGVPPTIY